MKYNHKLLTFQSADCQSDTDVSGALLYLEQISYCYFYVINI